MQTKSAKDLDQAARTIEALAEDRAGDLHAAWTALSRRGWIKTIRPGVEALRRRHPQAQQALQREAD